MIQSALFNIESKQTNISLKRERCKNTSRTNRTYYNLSHIISNHEVTTKEAHQEEPLTKKSHQSIEMTQEIRKLNKTLKSSGINTL